MTYKTYNTFSTKITPQSEKIPGSKQVKNNAGGYAYKLDGWASLDRFLVLGSEGGTYYATEQTLTKENANRVLECINMDGLRVIKRVLEISKEGRAPKNEPAIFVLAMCAKLGDDVTRKAAFEILPDVCRIGTHLFHFVEYAENMGGWGRAQKRAVGDWYNEKTAENLMYQIVKYQQRDGWSNRDLLRLSHPSPSSEIHQAIYKWITKNEYSSVLDNTIISAFEQAKKADNKKTVINLVGEFNLPREAIPTIWLNDADVWAALLEKMPMTAMIRNLAKMTNVGLLKPLSEYSKLVCDRLGNEEVLTKAKIHPISVLSALSVYAKGRGEKGSLEWQPVSGIVAALDKAFYKTFKNVIPSNKRIVLALDVSGSMTWGNIAGVPGLTPNVASTALALVTAHTEKNYEIVAFSDVMNKVSITEQDSLKSAMTKTSGMSFGGTDCALPILWAMSRGVEADAFVIYTDNESWKGNIHVSQALNLYRQKTGNRVKLIPVGMTATDFTVGDPDDAGVLNVVGFDTATPQLISDFIRD